MARIAPCVHLSFGSISVSKQIFFSVQFILNELISSHFLTSEIFIKISSLETLTTFHLETRKTIPIVSKFDEIFLGH